MTADELPSFQDLMLPILQAIGQGCQTIDACLPLIRSRFALTDEQMERLLPSGKQSYIANRAHWARNYMKHAGLVRAVKRGSYVLTGRGEQLLKENPPAINKKILTRYPEFVSWREKDGKTEKPVATSAPAEIDATPDEQIEEAFASLERDLAEELLEQVMQISPARFEKLVIDLLIAMGYGSGQAEMGRAIGKSGDGGIDGVINEDKLGLDAVYVQAKRYAAENTVGRPAVQAFVGSMTGESATKGVFVTTSSFSKDARDYVRVIHQRVVLIDGQRLARLMIDHGVGVKADKTYTLRSVDMNFFAAD